MRTVKIKAKYYKDLEGMYEELGLVNTTGQRKTVNPSNVLMSKQDYTKIKRTLQKNLKKEKPYLSKQMITKSVNNYLLNIGPNELAGDAVKPGYLIILD